MSRKNHTILWMILLSSILATGCAPSQAASTPVVTQASLPLATSTSAPLPETGVSTEAPAASPEATVASPAYPPPTGELVRYALIPEESEARYRVTEQLANIDLPTDAIGRTQAVSGTLVVDPQGAIVPGESQFVVDMGTLQSDSSRRDNFLRGNTLQTDQFPNVVFVPTAVNGLPDGLPESGQVSFQLIGDLTIREVTRPVTWEVVAQVEGDRVTGQATTSFTFADFELVQPRVPVVLSVDETIHLELDFSFSRVEG